MQQKKEKKHLKDKLECIDYAIECIKENDYEKLLLDIHKFIDTRLENPLKNIYEKYSLSSYENINNQTYQNYKNRLQYLTLNDNHDYMKNAMINFILNEDTQKTIDFFKKSISKHPFLATIFLAITYARHEQLQQAITLLNKRDKIIEDDKYNMYFFVYQGILNHNQSMNFKTDIDGYLSKTGLWKDNLNNAILLRILGKDDDALKYLNKIDSDEIEEDKDLYLLWVSYSVSYLKKRQDKDAIPYLNKALKLNVDTFEAARIKAICWSRDPDKIKQRTAIDKFTKLSKKCPIDNDIQRNLAIAYANQYIHWPITDQTDIEEKKIIDLFNLSIDHNPFHAPNYFDFATFYDNQGKFDKSLEYYAQAIKYAPYKLRYYDSYAKAFIHSKKLLDHKDISALDQQLTQILSTYKYDDKEQSTYSDLKEVESYLNLIEIKAKCLIHEYLQNNDSNIHNISSKIRNLITNISGLFSHFTAKKRDLTEQSQIIQMKSKVYETSSLLESYLEDLPKVNITDTNIITINNLVEIKLEIKDRCLFRGMNRASWEMKPNIFRGSSTDSNFKILENFRREAIGVSDKNYDHYTIIDWLGLMQHHGSVTPFLDWTQSFSIALFFAIHLDNPHDTAQYGIPCIYTLQYKKILSMEEIEQLVINDYNHDNSESVIQNTTSNNSKKIVVFAPKISHKRADIQKSMFTYHRSDINIEDERDFILKKHVISPLLIAIIKKTLEKDHINIATVYPDLQNLSKRLRNRKSINNLDFT